MIACFTFTFKNNKNVRKCKFVFYYDATDRNLQNKEIMIVSTVSTQTSFLSSCSDCTIKKMSYPSRPPFNIPNVRITKNNQFRNIFKPTIVKSIHTDLMGGQKNATSISE